MADVIILSSDSCGINGFRRPFYDTSSQQVACSFFSRPSGPRHVQLHDGGQPVFFRSLIKSALPRRRSERRHLSLRSSHLSRSRCLGSCCTGRNFGIDARDRTRQRRFVLQSVRQGRRIPGGGRREGCPGSLPPLRRSTKTANWHLFPRLTERFRLLCGRRHVHPKGYFTSGLEVYISNIELEVYIRLLQHFPFLKLVFQVSVQQDYRYIYIYENIYIYL